MCKANSSIRQFNGHTLALKKAMRLALENGSIAQKAVAIDLGVDEGCLSRYLSPEHPHALPIDLVPGWCESVGDAGVLRALAARCGYEIRVNSERGICPQTVQTLTVLLARHSGTSTGNLVQAIADGELSIEEARVCAPDLLRLQSIVNALVDVVSA